MRPEQPFEVGLANTEGGQDLIQAQARAGGQRQGRQVGLAQMGARRRILVPVIEPFGKLIEQEVASWPGVTAAPHRFGGVEFRVGRRELGHLHGNRLADLPLPVLVGRAVGSRRSRRLSRAR